MGSDRLLTLAEAASELNVSRQRIHQLLKDSLLDGVDLPAGRRRHVPGAGRVFASSVERLRNSRAVPKASDHRDVPLDRSASMPGSNEPRARYAAEAAAFELKVHLDSARERLHKERARTQKALEIAAQLLDLLRDTTAAADELDRVTDAYADTLTQFLAPSSPDELE